MTLFQENGTFGFGEQSYEQRFHSMTWLSWRRTREGGLVSEPIVKGGLGSAEWVKSKLLALDVHATTTECEGVAMSASRVAISPQEVKEFCQRHADAVPDTLGLISKLKLDKMLGTGRAR